MVAPHWMKCSMTMSSNVSFEDGQLGFVLIPNNSAILKEQASQRMYWPALLFSSCHALCRSIPSTRDQESFRTEWKYLEMVVVNAWKREGLITPDDGPVKVADKEGKMENWKAARHVYEKVGFVFVENNRIPGEVAGCCKHFGDDYYNVMRFDCKGKAPSRMSARRSTRRRIRSRLAPWSSS